MLRKKSHVRYGPPYLWDLGPLTLSGDRRRPDREYSRPHSPRAPSCRCCLVSASKGSGVLIGPKCARQNPTTGYMAIYIYGHIEMTVTTGSHSKNSRWIYYSWPQSRPTRTLSMIQAAPFACSTAGSKVKE